MIKKITTKNIDENFLDGFKRYQVTKKVLLLDKGSLLEKDDVFTENWEEEKLREVSNYLKDCSKTGAVYAAYSGKHVIGFVAIEGKRFSNYVNMPYIHVDERYRGQGIGEELIYFAALEAKLMGVDKLYISSHPAIETQRFYQKVGCRLAGEVNDELLAIEPLDIQLELDCDYKVLIKLLKIYLSKQKKNAQYFSRLASRFYRFTPSDDMEFLDMIYEILSDDYIGLFSVGTLWLKRRKSVLKAKYLDYYEKLAEDTAVGWGRVDQLCYRAINPVIEDGDNFGYLLKWSSSDCQDMRRVSLVAMLRSTKTVSLEYDYDKMIFLVNKLKNDDDFHVRKAVGWVLKCAFPTYPDKIESYLRSNTDLDRLIFRYALEHVPEPLRTELLMLR